MFYCSIINFEFEGEIKEDIKDEDKQYCRELFKLIMQVEWAVFIQTLIWKKQWYLENHKRLIGNFTFIFI